MCNEVMVDLKINRERSGLSGRDVAHLLGTDPSRVSRLEHGKAKLGTAELLVLCLIYGRPANLLFQLTTRALIDDLNARLSEMPSEPANWSRRHENRLETLNSLFERLQALNRKEHDS